MSEAGILHEDDRQLPLRIELIHGEIIQLPPIGRNHSAIIRRLIALLTSRIPSDTILDAQNSVLIDDHSEPDPDIVILPYQENYYAENGVTSEDVLLLIEVSDSTLRYDRNTKLPLYATAGIPEV